MYRHYLEKLVRTPLDAIVVSEGILDRTTLEAAHAEQDQSGKLFSDVLLDAETIDEWDLAKLVARSYSLPFLDVRMCSIPPGALDLLPLEWCRAHSVLPFDQFGKTIGLACVEVPSSAVIDEIATKTGCTPFVYVTLRRSLRDAIDEQLKRGPRGGSKPAAAAPAKAPAPAAAAGPASPPPPAPTAEPETAPPPRKQRVLAADLPRVSLRLDASAATVAQSRPTAGKGGTPGPKSGPVVAAPKTGPVQVAPPKTGPVSLPPGAAAGPPPLVTAAAVGMPTRKISPIQHLLSQPDLPPAPAPTGEPQRPKLASRIAPVLPPSGTAKGRSGGTDSKGPRTSSQGAASAATPEAKKDKAWESIFDSGDQAVRKTGL